MNHLRVVDVISCLDGSWMVIGPLNTRHCWETELMLVSENWDVGNCRKTDLLRLKLREKNRKEKKRTEKKRTEKNRIEQNRSALLQPLEGRVASFLQCCSQGCWTSFRLFPVCQGSPAAVLGDSFNSWLTWMDHLVLVLDLDLDLDLVCQQPFVFVSCAEAEEELQDSGPPGLVLQDSSPPGQQSSRTGPPGLVLQVWSSRTGPPGQVLRVWSSRTGAGDPGCMTWQRSR